MGRRSPRSAAARARIARWWFGAMPTRARAPPSGRTRAIDQLRRPVSGSRATIAPAVMYGPPSCSKKRGIGSSGEVRSRAARAPGTAPRRRRRGSRRRSGASAATRWSASAPSSTPSPAAMRPRELSDVADDAHLGADDVVEQERRSGGERAEAGADLELRRDRLGDAAQLAARRELLQERAQRLAPAGPREDRHAAAGRTNAPCPASATTSPSRATSTPRTSTRRMRPTSDPRPS